MPILITLLAGLSIVIGAALTKLSKKTHRIERFSIALALGSLVGLLFLDLIPEIFEVAEESNPFIIIIFIAIGFAALKVLDLFIPEHEDTHDNHDEGNSLHIGIISALALILHNIIEGMTLYSLSLNSLHEGLIFAIAIALHNIPMGMLIFSTLVKHKLAIKAVLMTIISFSTVLGAFIMMAVNNLSGYSENVINALVCAATGMIIYIIFMELLPHVLKTKPVYAYLLISAAGFFIVFASSFIGHEH